MATPSRLLGLPLWAIFSPMHAFTRCAVYLVGLTGLLAASPALAQDDSGVKLDLKALESLKSDKPEPPPAPVTHIIDFSPGSALPTDKARAALTALAQDVRTGTSRLTVVAYAAPGANGNENDARRLALRRAINVRQILVAAGVDGTRVNLQPQGARPEPDASSDQAEIIVKQP